MRAGLGNLALAALGTLVASVFFVAGVGIIASADNGGLSAAQAATQAFGAAVLIYPVAVGFAAGFIAIGRS